ncbi:hypothetical protein [Halopseudomonas salegens]|uniref:Lipoprotein n=1 Tax=Halopseudomonas salegens TaxID=1434072 RepID=A0A1H2FAP7_9GAMM|nr:hypothetical protein [Halopseudomonas salegens]SDU04038.1 hypothetical protein SAMN05216210_1394 [Halopseudomonas salegens]
MKSYTTIFVIALLAGCSAHSNTDSNNIIEQLATKGQPYFEHLVATSQYESLLGKIESGDEHSIRAASVLSQYADASKSQSLKYALSRALPKNPEPVMTLIPEYFSVSDICTVPYIEESIDIELRHIRDSIAALKNAQASSPAYIECIDIYKNIESKVSS